MLSPIIISLGGSLVAPEGVAVDFIQAFRALILEKIKRGGQFIVIVGGGKLSRRYQEAARELGVASRDAQDWVGIYATRLNAELLRVSLGEQTHKEIITDPAALALVTAPLAIGAGWKPGHSTDFDAVIMAEQVGAKRIVNLSNIDFVYDKDPRQFPDAKKIERISWKEFRSDLLPSEWQPGVNAPFDPVAAERAEEFGLEVVIMNGKPLDNLKNYLAGQSFRGTVIR